MIEKALEPFTEADDDDPDVVMESHDHWACGWIAGFSIRVIRDGHVTAAFRNYHELTERIAEYPILDEEDYSSREYDAAIENIADTAWRLKDDYELPDDWQCKAYDWLSNNDSGAVENTDDLGGYPNEESLRAAFEALEFRHMEAV